MRVVKHIQYVEIKQFFKVGIKQNNVSTVIWLIKFLAINARDPRHWEEVRCYIFVYITKYMFSLTSYHIVLHFNHYDTFYLDNKGCTQRFIEFTDENLKPKVQIEDKFIYIMN